jgi:hypothetical protein
LIIAFALNRDASVPSKRERGASYAAVGGWVGSGVFCRVGLNGARAEWEIGPLET